MNDVVLEALIILVSAAVLLWTLRLSWRHLWKRPPTDLGHGWQFIVIGFTLLFFQSVFDITDEFDHLSRFVIIGDTPVEAFLEKVGRLLGFLFLFVGYLHWRPAVAMHDRLQQEVAVRRGTEDALERVGRRMELILNAAGDGIYGLNREGAATFINPAAARMIGWAPEELAGKHLHDILHHSYADGRPFPRDACPIHASLKVGTVQHIDDAVFWRKDGTSFPVEYPSTSIQENGTVAGAVVTFQDITERRAEMDRAADVQAELLPRAAPDLAGFELAGRCVPAR